MARPRRAHAAGAPRKRNKPLEQFWQKVNEVKEERDADPEAWDFLFKGCIDETIYAYHELSYADRAAITH